MSPHECPGRPASPAGIAAVAALALALALPVGGAASLVGAASGGGCQVAGMELSTVPPCRVYDSRSGDPLTAGFKVLQVAGRCGIPFRAMAVSANVTVVGAQAAGYLTVYAGDSVLPSTTINFNAGQVRANNAVVELAGDGTGTVTVYYGAVGPGALTATVDLILDVNGFFAYENIKPGLAVLGVLPAEGGQFGGTLVKVSGTFPDPASTQVQFDQYVPASSPAPGSTTSMLFVTTPPFSGFFPTGPCVGPGGIAGIMNLPASVDVTVADAVTGCSITVTAAYSYLPTDTSCHVPPPPPPIASFTVSTSNANDVAIFTDTSTGSPLSWEWAFGDAHTSTVQNPVHDYMAPGTFLVSLTACNAGGCTTAAQFVTVPGA